MYYRYFGLEEEPFSIAVNPKYLFMSARHRDALAHLLYGVGAGGGFILLTGEVGTGKTTINRCLLQQLPAETDIAIILNPALNADELLATACDELGIDYERDGATLKELTDRLHAFLLENHRRGRNTVLLIDEAQHLQFEVLEQIRLLTNLETNTRKLLQIILVGQPELATMLAKPELRQLSQRITARYDLEPLNLTETDAYIRHRLQVAGLPANQELFPPSVVRGIFRESRGIPRLINVLCDRMLLGAYGQNKARVDKTTLRQAAAEVLGKKPGGQGDRPWAWGMAALVAVIAFAAMLWWQAQEPNKQLPVQVSGTPGAAAPVASAAPPAVPAPPVVAAVEPWTRDRELALRTLADHLGIPDATGAATGDYCAQLIAVGWRCESVPAETWDEVLAIDRPAVLALLTPSRFAAWATLVAVQGDSAVLLRDAAIQRMPLAALGERWRGEFTILWRPPAAYTGPISLGDSSPLVAWLAAEFATLDQQSVPLAQDRFNAALDARVRLFQRQFGLLDDGVVGLKTLLKLNAVRGDVASLRNSPAALARLDDN